MVIGCLLDLNNINIIELCCNNVGWYSYENSFGKIVFDNNQTKKYFKSFIKHPLVYWNLEIYHQNKFIKFDYITNISNHTFNIKNSYKYNSIYYINSPSMIYNHGEFLKNFKYNSSNELFSKTIDTCNNLNFKKIYKDDFINNNFSFGIFEQIGINGEIKILRSFLKK